jgi:hypothetical protein
LRKTRTRQGERWLRRRRRPWPLCDNLPSLVDEEQTALLGSFVTVCQQRNAARVLEKNEALLDHGLEDSTERALVKA